MATPQSQTPSLIWCTTPSSIRPGRDTDSNSSRTSVVSTDDRDCYHDEEQDIMMIDGDDGEEAEVDSVSTTEELLSFLDSAIGLWEDSGIGDLILEYHPDHDHLPGDEESACTQRSVPAQLGETGPSSKQ